MGDSRAWHDEAMKQAKAQCLAAGLPDRCTCHDDSGSCYFCQNYYSVFEQMKEDSATAK